MALEVPLTVGAVDGEEVSVVVGAGVEGSALGVPLTLSVGGALVPVAVGLAVEPGVGVGLGVWCDPPSTMPVKEVRVERLLPPV